MYYIKERNNPQFPTSYYKLLGKMKKTDAKRHENTRYGYNSVTGYSKENYEKKIAELREAGLHVME